MSKLHVSTLVLCLSVVLIFFLFFKNLFLPQLSIYATPDFGRNEIWSLNYPLKDFLAKSVKSGHLPFWTNMLGGGYPLFAEGIIGTLYLPNLVLFGLLPTPLAWNLSYIFIFLLIFLGSLAFFLKNIKSVYASFFAASVFTFSGYNVVHIPHYPLIQAISLLPILLFLAQLLWERPTKFRVFLFSFTLCQLIFIGHPQVTFMTLFTVFLFSMASNFGFSQKDLIIRAKPLFAGLLFGILLATPQILPSLELLPKTNIARGGLSLLSELSRFPYFPRYFITTIFPNFFGSPVDGTFPEFWMKKGIYWEINSFIGLIPFLLATFALFRAKRDLFYKFSIMLLLMSVFLSISGHFPLNILFLFPGLNLFRVTSRFLLLTTFSLSILSGLGLKLILERISSKKAFFYHGFFWLFWVGSIWTLMGFDLKYNPVVPFKDFLAKPQVASDIGTNTRVITDSSVNVSWNGLLRQEAWQNPEKFLYFLNGAEANSNILFGISNIAGEIAAPTERQSFLIKYPDYFLMGASSIDYLVATRKLPPESPLVPVKVYESDSPLLPNYYLYKNKDSLPRFRLLSDYEVKPFSYELPDWEFNNKNFTYQNAALMEKDPNIIFKTPSIKDINVVKDTDGLLVLETRTDTPTLLVIADSNYPGWSAWINGKRVKVYDANINQRALVLPEGENVVQMKFIPYSFYLGLLIAGASLIFFYHKKFT